MLASQPPNRTDVLSSMSHVQVSITLRLRVPRSDPNHPQPHAVTTAYESRSDGSLPIVNESPHLRWNGRLLMWSRKYWKEHLKGLIQNSAKTLPSLGFKDSDKVCSSVIEVSMRPPLSRRK